MSHGLIQLSSERIFVFVSDRKRICCIRLRTSDSARRYSRVHLAPCLCPCSLTLAENKQAIETTKPATHACLTNASSSFSPSWSSSKSGASDTAGAATREAKSSSSLTLHQTVVCKQRIKVAIRHMAQRVVTYLSAICCSTKRRT